MYYFSEPKSNDNDFKIKSSLKFQLIPYLPQPHCLVPSLPRVLEHPHEHWIQSPDQDYDPKLPLLEQTTHSLHWKWWWDPKNEVKEFRIISMLNNLSKINMHEQEVHKPHCSSEHRSKKKNCYDQSMVDCPVVLGEKLLMLFYLSCDTRVALDLINKYGILFISNK